MQAAVKFYNGKIIAAFLIFIQIQKKAFVYKFRILHHTKVKRAWWNTNSTHKKGNVFYSYKKLRWGLLVGTVVHMHKM